MQTNYLQSLAATNAAKIARAEAFIEEDMTDARQYAECGEKAYSIDSYASANRQRTKLAKLVGIQRALKTELAANARAGRIERKIAKLQTVGFVYEKPKTLTSHEIESGLDSLIDVFVPKKADSRLGK